MFCISCYICSDGIGEKPCTEHRESNSNISGLALDLCLLSNKIDVRKNPCTPVYYEGILVEYGPNEPNRKDTLLSKIHFFTVT